MRDYIFRASSLLGVIWLFAAWSMDYGFLLSYIFNFRLNGNGLILTAWSHEVEICIEELRQCHSGSFSGLCWLFFSAFESARHCIFFRLMVSGFSCLQNLVCAMMKVFLGSLLITHTSHFFSFFQLYIITYNFLGSVISIGVYLVRRFLFFLDFLVVLTLDCQLTGSCGVMLECLNGNRVHGLHGYGVCGFWSFILSFF